MRIVIASDHAGFELKSALVSFLRDELGHDVEDMGAHVLDEADDFPDFVVPAAKAVAQGGEQVRGIILGGSGQGEAMCANRVGGVRAAVYYGGNKDIVTLSRQHNNANVLSLGARFLNIDEAKEVVVLWLQTPFSDDPKYARRIDAVEKHARG